jgi:hypothetical protein
MQSTCTHLDTILDRAPSGDGCLECTRLGSTWVHFRMCQSCGHVGCCDASPNRHATAHHRQTQHPLIRSVSSPASSGTSATRTTRSSSWPARRRHLTTRERGPRAGHSPGPLQGPRRRRAGPRPVRRLRVPPHQAGRTPTSRRSKPSSAMTCISSSGTSRSRRYIRTPSGLRWQPRAQPRRDCSGRCTTPCSRISGTSRTGGSRRPQQRPASTRRASWPMSARRQA